ncbi:MAG: hypothetical protein MZV64_10340 [Ignavibacteriales bacterium]|nr:hypothetical protein [Ignavibacteriales bacterium]
MIQRPLCRIDCTHERCRVGVPADRPIELDRNLSHLAPPWASTPGQVDPSLAEGERARVGYTPGVGFDPSGIDVEGAD